LIEAKADRNRYKKSLLDYQTKKKEQEQRDDFAQKARIIIQEVASQTQKHIEIQISTLVSSCLAAIFPEPYEFQLRFVKRRNKTEADLVFIKNGKESDDILFVGGGGVADVAANIAFPLAIWSIKKTRNTMLLDEPSKFIHSPEYQERASQLIKEVSDKLKLQFIIISDQSSMTKNADKVFKVELVKGISHVKEIQ
jgi:hypothetical protein